MNLLHSAPADFKQARVQGLKRLPFEQGLFTGTGAITSAPIRTEQPFDDLVGSFNALVPRGSFVQMDVQVSSIKRKWSPWYGLVRWDGDNAGKNLGTQENSWGRVDIDTLKLKKNAPAFRYRIQMRATGRQPPVLTQIAVTCIDSKRPCAQDKPFQSGPWVREIKIKPRSQIEDQAKFSHAFEEKAPILCSPTSLGMVLEHWGIHKSTLQLSQLVHDRNSRLFSFGNWPLNIQAAASLGLCGYVARLRGFEDIQSEIAKGRPVIASVTIEPGDLTAEPDRKSAGHLVVAAGFTPSGDIIVYDPYSPDREGVRRVFLRREFRKIWLERKRGVAYVLGPRFPQEMAVGTDLADLRREPREIRRFDPADRNRLSQLPQDQRVRAIKAASDWVYAQVADQPHWNGKTWQGYPGWVQADSLAFAPPRAVPLPRVNRARGSSARDSLAKKILRAAVNFVGTPYVWGGLSDQGIDCSGLIYLSYKAAGLKLPRDARDQHRYALRIRRARLKLGDLVFLADSTPNIYHVMLYAGGDSLIESREKEGVLKTTFQARFGKPLSKIESGDRVDNLPGRAPSKIRVSFGAIPSGTAL